MAQRAASTFAGSKSGKAIARDHSRAAAEETKFSSFGELPAGINGGIARLKTVELKCYEEGEKAGKWYFTASAIVLSPTTHKDQRCEGIPTRIYEPLYDTPTRTRKTISDHWAWVLNELRKLGLPTKGKSMEWVEKTGLPLLVKKSPFVRFRTWASTPLNEGDDGWVNHEWEGIATDYVPESRSRVEEDIDDPEGTDGDDFDPDEVDPPRKPKRKASKPEPEEDEDEGDDLDEEALRELAEAADGGNRKAAKDFKRLALKAGLTEEETDSAEEWSDLIPRILGEETVEEEPEEDEEPEEPEEEEEETDFVPAKEDVYLYRPRRGPKKTPAKTPVECEVSFVSKKKKTVNLTEIDGDKEYKSVPWADLEEA